MKMIALHECCKFLSGGTPSKENQDLWKGNIPWFSPKDIKSYDLIDSQDHISDAAIKSSSTQSIESGTILIVCRSGVLAHTLPVGIVRRTAAFNQDVKALIPKSGFDSDFVALMIKAREQIVLNQGVKVGPTVHSLISGFIENLKIPLLELSIQRKIARKLKIQLNAADIARFTLKAQIENLTELGNAIVRESISHPDAVSYALGDVLDEVKRGIGKTWAAYPVLGATRSGLAPAKEGVGKYPEKYKPVLNGTLFYNPMRILIGSIAMVDTDDMPGITSPDYVVLRGREHITDTRWFYYWLRSPEGERCISSLARGAVRERMLFSRLAEGKITLPPFVVQEKASKALAEIRPLQTKLKAQLQEIELLPARLLEQAFQE